MQASHQVFYALCHGFLEGIFEMVGLLMVALAIACTFYCSTVVTYSLN